MKKFIQSQIDSFNGKIYKKSDLLKKNLLITSPMLFKIEIKNNKIFYDKKIVDNVFINKKEKVDRKIRIINILQKMLDKYKVKDTILIICFVDGYFWRNDIPVFNFSLPVGCQGLIYPNFDILDYYVEDKKYNFDQMKNKIEKYPITQNDNDLFFRGDRTSLYKSKIREKMQYEKLPFNVKLRQYVYIGEFKNHKYLLDLPGVKPWSVRLKYLFLMNSLVFRVSFFNSNNGTKDDGEKGGFQQSFDYLFKENRDYIHLKYDFFYDKEIPHDIYKKCINDIKEKYIYYENNQNEYKKIVNNMKKASKKLNLDEMLKYLHTLIENYTEKLLI
jgi:hypothetical protein